MTNLELIHIIDRLRAYPQEQPWFEFKVNKLEPASLGKSLSAVHNCALYQGEPFGYYVFGIQDKTHTPVGTHLHSDQLKVGNDDLIFWLSRMLQPTPNIQMDSFSYQGAHLIVITMPVNPHYPVRYESDYFYRISGSTVNLRDKPSILKQLFNKCATNDQFEEGIAAESLKPEEIPSLLDTEVYFKLRKIEKPKTLKSVLEVFEREEFIVPNESRYSITNLGAILFAQKLSRFSHLNGRRIRLIEYSGFDKQDAPDEGKGNHGYALALDGLLGTLRKKLPNQPEQLVGAQKLRLPAYPEKALREFIANALIHQDFAVTGLNPTVSIFSNRLEIRNAGISEISTDRWIDEEKSRNEKLADKMHDMHLCERRGSGVDNALLAIGFAHLPAPEFITSEFSTTVVLPGPQRLIDMDRADRIRICYQHTVLQYISHQKTTNTTLRTRLGLHKSKHTTVSKIFANAIEDGKIREAEPAASTKFKSYLPWWVE
jgi:ATP-dependent DNA helicase RecG